MNRSFETNRRWAAAAPAALLIAISAFAGTTTATEPLDLFEAAVQQGHLGGIYHLTGDATIPLGATVHFASGTLISAENLTVRGTLVADATDPTTGDGAYLMLYAHQHLNVTGTIKAGDGASYGVMDVLRAPNGGQGGSLYLQAARMYFGPDAYVAAGRGGTGGSAVPSYAPPGAVGQGGDGGDSGFIYLLGYIESLPDYGSQDHGMMTQKGGNGGSAGNAFYDNGGSSGGGGGSALPGFNLAGNGGGGGAIKYNDLSFLGRRNVHWPDDLLPPLPDLIPSPGNLLPGTPDACNKISTVCVLLDLPAYESCDGGDGAPAYSTAGPGSNGGVGADGTEGATYGGPGGTGGEGGIGGSATARGAKGGDANCWWGAGGKGGDAYATGGDGGRGGTGGKGGKGGLVGGRGGDGGACGPPGPATAFGGEGGQGGFLGHPGQPGNGHPTPGHPGAGGDAGIGGAGGLSPGPAGSGGGCTLKPTV